MKSAYARRNSLLNHMGFYTYGHYLNSPLWSNIRAKVLKRDRYSCKLCEARAFTVHHLDYKKSTLLGTSYIGLVSICQDCHQKVEFTRNGRKHTMSEVRSTYKRLSKAKRALPRGKGL